jgi:hypothetical protein
MAERWAGPPVSVSVRIELFGLPRLIADKREMDISLPPGAGYMGLVSALAEACPQLVGRIIRPDRAALEDGYVFNHIDQKGGTTFLNNGLSDGLSNHPGGHLGEHPVELETGDAILLLSSQAGG